MKATIIAEPINKWYVDSFESLLKGHPDVAEKLERRKCGRKVYWESKDTFEEVNYNLDERGRELEKEIYLMGHGVNEFMCVMTNIIEK